MTEKREMTMAQKIDLICDHMLPAMELALQQTRAMQATQARNLELQASAVRVLISEVSRLSREKETLLRALGMQSVSAEKLSIEIKGGAEAAKATPTDLSILADYWSRRTP